MSEFIFIFYFHGDTQLTFPASSSPIILAGTPNIGKVLWRKLLILLQVKRSKYFAIFPCFQFYIQQYNFYVQIFR